MPQQQCTNLELSQELKRLGYPQESLFYWDSNAIEIITDGFGITSDGEYAAPTVAELLEYLKSNIYVFYYNDYANKYICNYSKDTTLIFEDKNPANTLAKMIIHLLKNNLIELK